MQNTEFQNTVGYNVVWSENQQPVVAKLNTSQIFDIVQLEQPLDLSSRIPISKKDACLKQFPNCCNKLPTVDTSKTQVYAGIKYTNDNLNITTERPTSQRSPARLLPDRKAPVLERKSVKRKIPFYVESFRPR